MPRPDLRRIRTTLLESGVSPAHVARVSAELDEHYEDLFEAAREQGLGLQEAQAQAMFALGDVDDIAAIVAGQDEFKSWAWRFPRVAMLVYPIACLAALPVAPVIAGARHAAEIGRWIAGLALGALFTATLFLLLQLSITLS